MKRRLLGTLAVAVVVPPAVAAWRFMTTEQEEATPPEPSIRLTVCDESLERGGTTAGSPVVVLQLLSFPPEQSCTTTIAP
jgi:hypothetical protein